VASGRGGGGHAGGLVAALAMLIAVAVAAPSAEATAPYARKLPALLTPWTRSVSRVAPLPEYPRPQLERAAWLNLNGQWQYEQAKTGQAPPFGQNLAETILVPFPVQSPLSGIERGDSAGWYRRKFRIPRGWRGQHVLLNFGAVGWAASVYVNGHLAGTHRGDYTAFSLDITGLLRRGPNELIVGYVDPLGAAGEPIGKQVPGTPTGIHHSASSGIWQTVWLEPVVAAHLTKLDLTPVLRGGRLIVSATSTSTSTGSARARLLVDALAGNSVVASAAGRPGRPFSVRIPHPRLWSPSDPYLYGLRIRMMVGSRAVDKVQSYFGMRSISLGRAGGVTRILLNGHFVFQTGALDQGYWPDGLYTAPSDAALRFDIGTARRLGYNMLRKHVKVEPERWYYWADRLGMLVWQDMPAAPTFARFKPGTAQRAEFRRELSEMVVELRSHPSIVTWVPFNEGWGQFDVTGITNEVKRLDPSRLVDSQSGSANCCDAIESSASDIRDTHQYFGPFAAPPDRRATVIGEYGGLLPPPRPGHRWPGTQLTVGNPAFPWSIHDAQAFLTQQYAALRQELRSPGASASVYTELAAYEDEIGIISYDRRAFAVDPRLLRRLNTSLITASGRISEVRRQRRPVVPPGTTGFWRFNEGSGASAADSSGHGHALTLAGGAGWTRGVHGSALSLGGVGQLAAAAGPVIDTHRSYSVAVWLNSRLAGQSAAAVSQRGPDGSAFSLGIQTAPPGGQERAGEVASGIAPPRQRSWWIFEMPNSSTCPPEMCGVQAANHFSDGRTSPPTGSWHYVVGVRNGQNRTLSVYVDGIPQDVEQTDPLLASIGPLTVGAGVLDYPGPDAFVGAVDDLRTFDMPLTPGQVWQLYLAER
jgi:hypothetical protein